MNKILRILLCAVLITAQLNGGAQQVSAKSAGEAKQTNTVETTAGQWKFVMFPHKIIKATFKPTGSTRNEQVSDAVIAKPLSQPFSVKRKQDEIIFSWSNGMSAEVNRSGVEFKPGGQQQVSLINIFYSDDHRGFKFSLKPGEKIFGTGERSVPLNRRGYKLPLDNAPAYGYQLNAESLNFSVPFIMSSENYAIFFDNPSKGFLDIGKTNPDILEYSVTSGELSFYIISGQNFSEILDAYHSLVGTQPMPPRWAMGNLMSRFGYRDEKQVTGIVAQMKADSVPFDAVIFDLFWFGDSIKNTLGNLSWVNKKAWPDPKKMIADFRAQNINTVLITEPFVLNTSSNYENSKHLHATDSSGAPYILQQFYFGKGGIIDVFRKDAQKWFYGKYKQQMDIGVNGWWGDLGEPETHPADVYHDLKDLGFKRKFAAGEIHNIYGHYWSKMLAENYRKDYPDKRLFHLNRSGYAGSPRYNSFPWSGDVSRSWNGLKGQLPLMQGMSISGIPYIHSDAGGFAGGDGDAELYVRWLQFAAFTPIYRPHGTAFGDLEPGVKDIPSEASLWPEPTKSLARNAAVTRYRWLPYNYNLAYLQAKSGKPLMKPMFFLNVTDSNLYKAGDQYLWGDNVMVAPVTDKGQTVKSFYVPSGMWTNMSTLKPYVGPAWFTDSAISMESIPVFAKEGSFIPTLPGMQNTAEYNNKRLTILYFPSSKPSSYTLYEDDGADAKATAKKKYETTTFSGSGMKKSTEFVINSDGGKYPGRIENREMSLVLENIMEKPQSIKVDRLVVDVDTAWDPSKKELTVPFIFRHKKTAIQINFK